MSHKLLTFAIILTTGGVLAFGALPAQADDVPQTFGSDSDYGTPPVPPPMPVDEATPESGAETTWDSGYDVEPVAGTPEDPGQPVVLEDYPAPAPGTAGEFIYVDGEAEPAADEVIEIAPEAAAPAEDVIIEDVSGWNDTAPPVIMSGSPCDTGCGPAPAPYVPPAAPAVAGCRGFQGCGTCGDSRRCCPDHYINFGPEVFPGLGFGFNFGYRLVKRRSSAISAEIGFSYQDLYDEFMGEDYRGSYWAWRMGVRFDFANPCAKMIPYARGGLQLWELSQVRDDPIPGPGPVVHFTDIEYDFIKFHKPGTQFGFYAGVGVDFRFSKNWTMGPEISYIHGINVDEGGKDNSSLLFRWNITYNF